MTRKGTQTALEPSERQIQRQIVDYLQLNGWLTIQTYLGSTRGGSVWMQKGMPDLCAIKDGRHIWLEVKTPKGRLSAEQVRLHNDMREAGAEVYVVRDVKDVLQIVKSAKTNINL